MRTFGLFTQALLIEVIAVGAIVWFVAGGLPNWELDSRPAQTTRLIGAGDSDSPATGRPAFVRSKLSRVALDLRASANQLIDEALATWFNK